MIKNKTYEIIFLIKKKSLKKINQNVFEFVLFFVFYLIISGFNDHV